MGVTNVSSWFVVGSEGPAIKLAKEIPMLFSTDRKKLDMVFILGRISATVRAELADKSKSKSINAVVKTHLHQYLLQMGHAKEYVDSLVTEKTVTLCASALLNLWEYERNRTLLQNTVSKSLLLAEDIEMKRLTNDLSDTLTSNLDVSYVFRVLCMYVASQAGCTQNLAYFCDYIKRAIKLGVARRDQRGCVSNTDLVMITEYIDKHNQLPSNVDAFTIGFEFVFHDKSKSSWGVYDTPIKACLSFELMASTTDVRVGDYPNDTLSMGSYLHSNPVKG
jgi:hypothetical protein